MAQPRLILIEGIPNSGKSSTARFVCDWLVERGISAQVTLEGDVDHPADYESVARLSLVEYQALGERFPTQLAFLERYAIQNGEEVFFQYRKLMNQYPGEEHRPLLETLAEYEIYNLPAAEFTRLIAGRWASFRALAAQEQTTHIFECCFLQNPSTTLLARHNWDASQIGALIARMESSIQPLNPVLLYLEPASIRQTLEQAAGARPREWLEYVIQYVTGGPWGQAARQSGFEGMVAFYLARRDIERTIFENLHMPRLWLARAGEDWPDTHAKIEGLLQNTFLAKL